MAKEQQKGFYSEFTRTPEEERQIKLKRKVKELEERVSKLEKIIVKMGGKIDD